MKTIESAAHVAPLAYSIKDACKLLSVSRSFLYELEARGNLKFTRIAGRTLVLASEIQRLIGQQEAA